jgi:hypothetical protein
MRIPVGLLAAAVIVGFAVTVYIYLAGPVGIPYYTEGNFSFADVGYAATSYYRKIVVTANQTANVTLYFASAVFVVPADQFKPGQAYTARVPTPGGYYTYILVYDPARGYGTIYWKEGIMAWKALMVNLTTYYLFYPTRYSAGDVFVCPPGLSGGITNGIVMSLQLSYSPSSNYNPILLYDGGSANCGGTVSYSATLELGAPRLSYTVSPTQSAGYVSSMTTVISPRFFAQPYIIIAAQSTKPATITIYLR